VNLLKNRVFLLSRRWPNHASHSGYDILGRYVGTPLAADPLPKSVLPDRLVWRLQRELKGYDRTSAALEVLAARHMATHRNCLYHVLYGDNCFNFLGHLNGWRGHQIIASYHHPPSKFAGFVQKTGAINRLSAAIVVGRNQLELFEGVLPPGRIFYVPHPINTSFFSPPSDFSQREDNLCLFVGAHLRDLETLRALIEDAWLLAPQIKFVIVLHPKDIKLFEGVVGNYRLLAEVSEADLLSLYQTASLLVLPLQDCTANNTILEAMSCGLPMVVTDIGAVRDYVSQDGAILVPPYDPAAILTAVLELLDRPDKLRTMSISTREQALKLDWQPMAAKMCGVYEQILER
jgi:glycosyltransferase involved in cell wall biosynthesis